MPTCAGPPPDLPAWCGSGIPHLAVAQPHHAARNRDGEPNGADCMGPARELQGLSAFDAHHYPRLPGHELILQCVRGDQGHNAGEGHSSHFPG